MEINNIKKGMRVFAEFKTLRRVSGTFTVMHVTQDADGSFVTISRYPSRRMEEGVYCVAPQEILKEFPTNPH